NVSVLIRFQDSESRRILRIYRNGSNSYIRLIFTVEINHLAEVHLVKLVARKHQNIVVVVLAKVFHRLANRICRALIPVFVSHVLLGGKNINKAFAENIEMIGVLDM